MAIRAKPQPCNQGISRSFYARWAAHACPHCKNWKENGDCMGYCRIVVGGEVAVRGMTLCRKTVDHAPRSHLLDHRHASG